MKLVESELRADEEIKKRLDPGSKNRLHLTVVAAADQEPSDKMPIVPGNKYTEKEIAAKRSKNRRIEVRYLSDDRLRLGTGPDGTGPKHDQP